MSLTNQSIWWTCACAHTDIALTNKMKKIDRKERASKGETKRDRERQTERQRETERDRQTKRDRERGGELSCIERASG